MAGRPVRFRAPGIPVPWLVVLGALLFLACDLPPSYLFVPVLDVHGLLLAGADTLGIHVNRTYGITERFEPNFTGVEALAWRGADTWQLGYREGSYYSAQSLPGIRSFDTFYLRVFRPGFDTVRGRTFVPGRFSILSPTAGDTVRSRDFLVWTRSRYCKGYFVALKHVQESDTFYAKLPIPNESIPGLPYDTTTARIPLFFISQEPEGPYTLHLLACDTNYYDWVEGGARDRRGSDSAHISGGVGVFGSAVACSVRVYIKRD